MTITSQPASTTSPEQALRATIALTSALETILSEFDAPSVRAEIYRELSTVSARRYELEAATTDSPDALPPVHPSSFAAPAPVAAPADEVEDLIPAALSSEEEAGVVAAARAVAGEQTEGLSDEEVLARALSQD